MEALEAVVEAERLDWRLGGVLRRMRGGGLPLAGRRPCSAQRCGVLWRTPSLEEPCYLKAGEGLSDPRMRKFQLRVWPP